MEYSSEVEEDTECKSGTKVRWKFSLCASIKSRKCSTDAIGTIAFDQSQDFLATGGIARKIRVYHVPSLVSDAAAAADDDDEEEVQGKRTQCLDTDNSALSVVCTPARLSSIKWHQKHGNVIGCGDYDGVVSEWDFEHNVAIVERDEHDGHRVWSIDYANWLDGFCASGSDDGTLRMWTSGNESSVMVIPSPDRRPVCCVEFSPNATQIIGLASADGNIYLHDLRAVARPLYILKHHSRAASYVKFLSDEVVVTSSIDSTIKLWNLSSSSPVIKPMETFTKHQNVRNFVGLSAWNEGGLVACGSETNDAFVYEISHGNAEPILRHSFSTSDMNEDDYSFVSAVCWRQKELECMLTAANSQGIVDIIYGHPA